MKRYLLYIAIAVSAFALGHNVQWYIGTDNAGVVVWDGCGVEVYGVPGPFCGS